MNNTTETAEGSGTPPCYLGLTHTAKMAAFLLEAGWELHLNTNAEKTPAIWKARREWGTTHVDSCELSLDDVLDLQQAGCIERCRTFEVGNETVTVFRHRSSR